MLVPIALGSVASLLVSLLVMPLLIRLAHRLGVTDKPDSHLKPHAKPVAYLGGAGIYLGWLAGLGAVQLWSAVAGVAGVGKPVWLIAAVAGGILLIGLIDDVRSVNPWARLAAEAGAAMLLFAGGVRYAAVPLLDPATSAGEIAAVVLQIVLVAGACNATNLLDGLDGLCGGVVAIGMIWLTALAGGFIWLHGRGAALGPELSARLGQVLLIAPLLAASLVGFLRYNYRPARVFMGDAGSLLLGLLIAGCLTLLAGAGGESMKLGLGGLFIFALPILDALLTFVRRKINRRPIFEGDRSHFYDQLVDRGMTVAGSVNVCYLLAAGFGAIGWLGAVAIPGFWPGFFVYLVAVLALAGLVWRFKFVRVDRASR